MEQERGIALMDSILHFAQGAAAGKTYPLHILDTVSDLIYEEDETISCKDRSSGVKCLKVKSGTGHWKPFYQTSKF